MKSDQLFRMKLENQTVWITMYRPIIIDPISNQQSDLGFVCAFKIGEEPRMVDGEYLKENGVTKFFPDTNTAICAVNEEVRRKLGQ